MHKGFFCISITDILVLFICIYIFLSGFSNNVSSKIPMAYQLLDYISFFIQ